MVVGNGGLHELAGGTIEGVVVWQLEAGEGAVLKAGDEVATYFIYPLKGDRADIRVANFWKDGVLTSVVSRKLVTGSKYDVQFNNLDAQYAFGFAAFDNAQVRHAVHFDAKYLAFAK